MPEVAGITLIAAFMAGIVSFLSPCILPLVPGYVSFVTGRSLDDLAAGSRGGRFAALRSSLPFVAGFSAVFLALGASASAIGRLFLDYRYEASMMAGTLVVLFGLHMVGLLRLGWMNRAWHPAVLMPAGRRLASLGLGAAFAFGWTPCVGPILASILGLAATRLGVADGVILLSVYSLGLALPFLLVATFTDRLVAWFAPLKRAGRTLQRLTGLVMIAIGVAMATGYLTSFGTWMLREFPIFERVVL